MPKKTTNNGGQWLGDPEIKAALWEKNRQERRARDSFIPQLKHLLGCYNFEEAEKFYQNNKGYINEEQYQKLCNDAKADCYETTKNKVVAIMQYVLDRYQFDKAEVYYQKNKEYIDTRWYEDAVKRAHEKRLQERVEIAESNIKELFGEYLFNQAGEYYGNNKEYIDSNWYEKTETIYRRKYEVESLLQKNHFLQADNLYKQYADSFSVDEYIETKSEYLQAYIKKTFDISVDTQQSLALAETAQNLLVTARAGSGKTRTLTCYGMLLASCGYIENLNTVLILAFNRKAADEIKTRINTLHKVPLDNIRTFHSLAHRIVQPDQDIKEDYENEMTEHLKTLLQNDPKLKPNLYDLFKKEMEDIDYKGLLLNESDYYKHARDCWQSISLGGDRVKSYGEKCIADFFFEHNLTYKYEKPYLRRQPNGNLTIYKPDFAIFDSAAKITYILEHWAIPDKRSYSNQPIWRHSSKTEREYAEEREKKRQYWRSDYWQKRKHYLLETDIFWLQQGRDEFENRLKQMLEKKGIQCNKLPEKELLEKVYRKHSTKLFRLFVGFIQKCRRYGYTPETIKKRRAEYRTSDPKEEVFLQVAPEIYAKYEKNLEETKKLDFDRLIHLAIQEIRDTKGKCFIRDDNNKINIAVKDLEYILIDEYQDFSKPFYDMIGAITEFNPNVKLFCVGDDWQAINGFAGSDLKYFTDFEKHYCGTSRRNILVNYRSGSKVVEAGNDLMAGLGEKSRWDSSHANKGSVQVVNIEDYHIEGRNNQEDTEQYSADKKYIQACEITIPTKDGTEWKFSDFDTARYIKAIHLILKKNMALLAEKNTECLILGRRNQFGCFKSTNEFKEKLLDVFSEEEINHVGKNRITERIHVMTAHKAKGKEADIVFVLRCNERSFPMLHPDNRLFGIFGETEQKVLEEERRLFYVALTRAKQKVFLLTEVEDKSRFLDAIQNETSFLDEKLPF